MRLGSAAIVAVVLFQSLIHAGPLKAEDSLVVYSGRILAGIDSRGDLFFALDEALREKAPDGKLDRLFVVQGPSEMPAGLDEQASFVGDIYYWSDKLVVKNDQAEVVASYRVAEGGNTTWSAGGKLRPAARVASAVGIIRNTVAAASAVELGRFLETALTESAQAGLRPGLLVEHGIRYPDPGGGGGDGGGCSSGGPGSTSCSVTDGADSCSVSCSAGYYACCVRGGAVHYTSCYCVRQ